MALDNFALQNTNPLEAYLQAAGGIQTLQNNQQVMQLRQQQMEGQQAAQQLAQQQAEAAQAAAIAKQQYQVDMYNTDNPYERAKKIALYTVRYPEEVAGIKQATQGMSDVQRTSMLGFAGKITSATDSGRFDLGKQEFANQIAAMKTGGAPPEQIAAIESYQHMYDYDPKGAILGLGVAANAIDPATYEANIKAAEETRDIRAKRPLESAKTTAQTAQIYSDIDFKREDNRIKAMRAAADKEMDALKKQELQQKIALAEQELTDKKAEKTATGEGAAAKFDDTIQTINNVMTHAGLSATVGKSSLFPTMPGSESADFQAVLETLKSQQFLASVQAMKGVGALSDAEGAKLNNAISNLDVKQSEAAFRKNLQAAMDIVTAAKARSGKQYGASAPPLIFDPRKTSYGAFVGGK